MSRGNVVSNFAITAEYQCRRPKFKLERTHKHRPEQLFLDLHMSNQLFTRNTKCYNAIHTQSQTSSQVPANPRDSSHQTISNYFHNVYGLNHRILILRTHISWMEPQQIHHTVQSPKRNPSSEHKSSWGSWGIIFESCFKIFLFNDLTTVPECSKSLEFSNSVGVHDLTQSESIYPIESATTFRRGKLCLTEWLIRGHCIKV